jgi:hypothetical protein
MDQNFTEISPDHRTPNTEEVQRMIELAFFQREHANISRDRRIAVLEAENAGFRRKLGLYAMLECGQIPQVSDLTKIGCQIWYSPHLTAVQRRIKSVWSLRLTISILHHRVMEEISGRLFPFQQFYKTARLPKNRNDALMQICDALQEGKRTGETWCGFVQAFTDGGGRPYVRDQVAILQDHEFDTAATATQARVYLLLGSNLHKSLRRVPPQVRATRAPFGTANGSRTKRRRIIRASETPAILMHYVPFLL